LRPNIITYNTLIKVASAARSPVQARRALQMMQENGVTPDRITMNTVLHAAAGVGRIPLLTRSKSQSLIMVECRR